MGQPEPAPTQPNFGQGDESHDGGQPEPAPTQPNFGQDDDDDDDNRKGGDGGEQSSDSGGNIDIDNSKTSLGDIFSSGSAPSTIDTIFDTPPSDDNLAIMEQPVRNHTL
jgi:hypothetical protein